MTLVGLVVVKICVLVASVDWLKVVGSRLGRGYWVSYYISSPFSH